MNHPRPSKRRRPECAPILGIARTRAETAVGDRKIHARSRSLNSTYASATRELREFRELDEIDQPE